MNNLNHAQDAVVKVSTLELFFDLVFVFTITQVTGLVVKAEGITDYLKAALVLAVTWWMYAGYVWLTNNVETRALRPRLLILTAMAGFLVMALAIPRVFGEGALTYGLGYLLVMLIHTGLFTHARNPASVRAILSLVPYNIAVAALVIVAAFTPAPWDGVLWAGAALVMVSTSLQRQEHSFVLSAGHFAERHGLVTLIVLGESLIAIGNGAEKEPLGAFVILAAVLGLALSAALWWMYFDRDDTRAEHALAQANLERRAQLAGGYGYAHLILIAGVVVIAAGVKQVISHLIEPYPVAAWNLGVGVALYLFGLALFRSLLGIGPIGMRLLAVVLTLALVPVGLVVGGLAQLGLSVALIVGLLMVEAVQDRTREPNSSTVPNTVEGSDD